MAVSVGTIAPSFQLRGAHGRDVALEDYRGRRHVVVWFSKGMACPFCRHQMSQLSIAYPRLRGLNAEVVHITPTPVDRARMYARRFRLDFPYLSDPTFATWTAWGLALRPRSGRFLRHPDHTPPSSFGSVQGSLWEWSQVISEEDGGFFIVDQAGIVRHAQGSSYYSRGWKIPSIEIIVRVLDQCERDAAVVRD